MRFKTFIIVLFVILVALTGYFYFQYNKTNTLLHNPTLAAKEEADSILPKVARLMDLPTGENPTIGTVVNVSKLKGQPFFTKSKNGDKIIIYSNARKAILYRPSENKIIDVTQINIGATSQPPLKVALYNGTEKAGLAQTTQEYLTKKYTDIQVVLKADAKKKTYDKTLVIDLTGSKKDITQALANDLKATVTSLPADEASPSVSADILVILGK